MANSNPSEKDTVRSTITPWLTVRNGTGAVEFYKSAFGAVEVYRLDSPDGGVVVRLAVNGAEFWLSSESPEHESPGPETLGGGSVRMILTVADPDAAFARAVAAGATQVYPVSEGHGWRIGRIIDPYGHHWEIGKQLIS